MLTYSVFGEQLRSEIPFPELRPATANGARWTLRVARTGPRSSDAELLGSMSVMPGVDVRLYRIPNGYRLTYDDTGTFDISGKTGEIEWFQGQQPWVEGARLDIINRVLPLALHAAGLLCLHGSAVSLDGQAIAFLAPSAYGKSSLAMAMADVGARIMTDDTVAVELQSPVIARPGVHSVRLLDDAAQALVGEANQLKALSAYRLARRDLQLVSPAQPAITKQVLPDLPADKLMFDAVPLTAIYLLRPVSDTGESHPVKRTQLSGARAALSLLEHIKSVTLLKKSEAPVLLDHATTIAGAVPIYLLEVLRDLGRLRDVARQLAQWQLS
jgi:hypothetical protein